MPTLLRAVPAVLALVLAAPAARAQAGASPKPPAKKLVRLVHAPLAATVLRADQPARPVEPAAGEVALGVGDLLVTRTASAAVRRPTTEPVNRGADRWALPYQLRFLDSGGEVRTARLVAEVAGGGLRMTGASGAGFSGMVFLGLEDEEDRSRTYALPAPAQVIVTAPIDRVEPGRFALERTNAFVEVSLHALDPPDGFRARIRASTDPQGLEVDIPVTRPELSLRVSPEKIQGLGVELATVDVVAKGLPRAAGLEVTLTATRGSLTPGVVTLDDQGRGVARIRSIATGATTVEALSPPLKGGKATATFAWPWVFALAALLGGGAGAAIRRSQAKGRARRPYARDVLVGALAGVVVAVLYSIGVNVLPVSPSAVAGEALVFGLAAVGGFLGLRIPKAAG